MQPKGRPETPQPMGGPPLYCKGAAGRARAQNENRGAARLRSVPSLSAARGVCGGESCQCHLAPVVHGAAYTHLPANEVLGRG